MSFAADDRSWEWTIWDTLKRSSAETLGVSDPKILTRFKDAWVHRHRQEIKEAADCYGIPEVLLAGTCWIEVGGDSDMIQKFASGLQNADQMEQPFTGELEVTQSSGASAPFGPVSASAKSFEAADDPWDGLTAAEQARIVECLDHEPCNVGVVARQLRRLKQLDFGDDHAPHGAVIRLSGSRYHLGPQVPRVVLEADTRYGDFILAKSNRLSTLIEDTER